LVIVYTTDAVDVARSKNDRSSPYRYRDSACYPYPCLYPGAYTLYPCSGLNVPVVVLIDNPPSGQRGFEQVLFIVFLMAKSLNVMEG
jgi:hypothetical protein